MKKTYRVDKVLERNLNEQDPFPEEIDDEEDEEQKKGKQEKSKQEKEKEKEQKDISDVDKTDMEDDEDSETVEDEEVAVSITMNADAASGGQIKLVPFKKLSSLVSIESILRLFNIDPENIDEGFKDRLEISIKSPITDFKDEEYIIRLMDMIGEISIQKEGFSKTLTKKSAPNTNLQQAVTQQIGTPGEEGSAEIGSEEETKPEKAINLDYLPDLNYDFKKSVKNEFFDRILSSQQ